MKQPMTKQELVKKWMKEAYLDELNHFSVMEEVIEQDGFYSWDKDDVRLIKLALLERRMKRREHRIFTHFGFKKGRVWLCEADHKVRQKFLSYCHYPEALYEMFRLMAETTVQRDAVTLRSWLMEATENGMDIHDVPPVLYKIADGWGSYTLFLWNNFRSGELEVDSLIDEFRAIKRISVRMKYEPRFCDERISKRILEQLRFLGGFMRTLKTAREAHEISEAQRKRLMERNGLEYALGISWG
jgi:hypothetical protein